MLGKWFSTINALNLVMERVLRFGWIRFSTVKYLFTMVDSGHFFTDLWSAENLQKLKATVKIGKRRAQDGYNLGTDAKNGYGENRNPLFLLARDTRFELVLAPEANFYKKHKIR